MDEKYISPSNNEESSHSDFYLRKRSWETKCRTPKGQDTTESDSEVEALIARLMAEAKFGSPATQF